MNREDIIRMARECGFWLDGANQSMPMWVIKQEELERFATLVAEQERKRIIASNAPEIEKINAHIKELEVAVLEEREACAKLLEEAAQAAKDVDPQGFVWIAIKTSAEGIRKRGQA